MNVSSKWSVIAAVILLCISFLWRTMTTLPNQKDYGGIGGEKDKKNDNNDGKPFTANGTTVIPAIVESNVSHPQHTPRPIIDMFANGWSPTETDATIVAATRGGLGNVIIYIAHAYALHVMAASSPYNLTTNIVLHASRGNGGRHGKGRTELLQCWPQFRSWTWLLEEKDPRLVEQKQRQDSWLGVEDSNLFWSPSTEDIHQWPTILFRVSQVIQNNNNIQTSTSTTNEKPRGVTETMSLPTLYANSMIQLPQYVNFAKEVQSGLFYFDDDQPGCCPDTLPDPDETVFHFRNFDTELSYDPSVYERFLDVSPQVAAEQLLGHLHPGDKVVVVTNFMPGRSNTAIYNLLNALLDRGLSVRVTKQHTALQDLCFMKHAQKELVGSIKSSFYHLAALMNTEAGASVRMYQAVRDPQAVAGSSCPPLHGIPCDVYVVPKV